MDINYHKDLKKEWIRLSKKEEKYFQKCSQKSNKLKENAVFTKIEEKIPKKVNSLLEKAFFQAFEKTFINGEFIIEKTFDKEDISLEFDVNDFRVQRQPNRKSIKMIDSYVKKNQRKNQSFVTAEGLGMGIVGVSLVDIPIFLGMILKGIYETSLSFGYNYQSEQEKVFILRMITASLETGVSKRKKDKLVESVLFSNEIYDVEKEMRLASKSLTKSLLLAKFIQGFIGFGVVGGAMSVSIYNEILEYVTMKYKKRYLFSLQTTNKLEK